MSRALPRRLPVVVLVAAALGGTAAPGRAAAPAPDPASGVEVLPATRSLPAVVARVRGQRVCFGEALPAPRLDGGSDGCADPAARDDAAALLELEPDEDGAQDLLVGAVPAGAASVRVALTGGQRLVARVVPAPAALGPRGRRFAFFRLRLPDVRPPAGLADDMGVAVAWAQVLGPDGAVVGVQPRGPAEGALDDDLVGARIGPTRTRSVARGGGGVVRAVTYSEEVLAPTVAELDRTVLRACLDVLVRRADGSGSGGPTCVGADEGASPYDDLLPLQACRPDVSGIEGFVPAGTSAATAVLGSGRRVRLPLLPLGRALQGRQAVAAVAPRGEALRAVVLGPSRRRVELGSAPARIQCLGRSTDGAFGYVLFPERDPAIPPAATVGPLAVLREEAAGRLRGAEGPAGTLCLGVDPVAPTAADCRALARAPGASLVARAPAPGGRTALGGVTGPRAAAVRVELARRGGPRRRVQVAATPAPPGAGGAYAGRLRTFALLTRPGEQLSTVTALDAAGHVLEAGPGDADLDVVGEPSPAATRDVPTPLVRIGHIRGGGVGWRAALRVGRTALRCSALTRGARPDDNELLCASGQTDQVAVSASCAAGGLRVEAAFADRASRLRVTDDRGRLVPVRTVALGRGSTFQVAALGRRRGASSVEVLRGGRTRSVRVDAPSAARQCGYGRTALPL